MPTQANHQRRKKPSKQQTKSSQIYRHNHRVYTKTKSNSVPACVVFSQQWEKNSIPRHIKFSDLAKQAQESSAAFSCRCHICINFLLKSL